MKTWIIILLTRAKSDHLSSGAISNDDDDDDEAEDYTVYECPGLAPVSFLYVEISKTSITGSGLLEPKYALRKTKY